MNRFLTLTAPALLCLAFVLLSAGCQVKATGQVDTVMGVHRLHQQ